MEDTTGPRAAGQSEITVSYERLANLADLNWRWKRTLAAIAGHIDRGNPYKADHRNTHWPFNPTTTREHCDALVASGYILFTIAPDGWRRYEIRLEKFDELATVARMLGRL